jgi:hypothetical protein
MNASTLHHNIMVLVDNVHADGKGLSCFAGDAKDWTQYYVNQ